MDDTMANALATAIKDSLSPFDFPNLNAPFRDAMHGVHLYGLDGAVAAVLTLTEIAVTKFVDIPSILAHVCDKCTDVGPGTIDTMYLVIDVMRDLHPVYAEFVCEVRKHGGRGVMEAIIGEHIARRATLFPSASSCRAFVDALPLRLTADSIAEAIRDNKERLSEPSVPPHWPDVALGNDGCKPNRALDIRAATADMQSHLCMPQLGAFTFTIDGDLDDSPAVTVPYQVVTAGGCPAAALTFPTTDSRSRRPALFGNGDLDVYVVCDSADKGVIASLLVHVVKLFEDRVAGTWRVNTVIMTKQATTFNMVCQPNNDPDGFCQVQFSMRVYPSVASILLSYDLSCVCVAYDGTSFITTPMALWSHVHRCVIVNPLIASTVQRCFVKYPRRGFHVAVPGSAAKVSAAKSHSRKKVALELEHRAEWNFGVFVAWQQQQQQQQLLQQQQQQQQLVSDENEWGSDVAQIVYDAEHGRDPGEVIFRSNAVRVYAGGSKKHHADILLDDILYGKDAIVRSVSWWSAACAFYNEVA